MSQISIEPKTVTHTDEWTSFTVTCKNLILNEKAIFTTTFYNLSGKIIDSFTDVIEGEEYSNWSNNDDYIISLVAQKHGVTIVPNPEPPTEQPII